MFQEYIHHPAGIPPGMECLFLLFPLAGGLN